MGHRLDLNVPDHLRAAALSEAQQVMDELTGVTAVVVSTTDGFDIASVMRRDMDPTRLAALASSIAAIGEVVSSEAQLGRSRSVTVDTECGTAVVFSVHRNDCSLVINVIATADALIGQLNYRTSAFAKSLARL